MDTVWFVPLLVIAITLGWGQYWIDFFVSLSRQKEIETRFPDFVRNLVSNIKSGMPTSQAIVQSAKNDYGALTPYVKRLAHQVEWNIPVSRALEMFAESTKNQVIKRAISTVIEAETAGGNMEDVLETITSSVIRIKKFRMERKAAIHSQIVQSYVIFAVFIGVMIVIQNFLIPYIAKSTTDPVGASFDTLSPSAVAVGGSGQDSLSTISTSGNDFMQLMEPVKIDTSTPQAFIRSIVEWALSIYGVFIMLAIIQGFFTGLVVGKLAEGDMKTGIKHSLILMTVAFTIISFAQSFL
jgi:flagellar protein FlaJ